jgi:antitoxin (DNA-binding transcriptional repressor) of toxin-antitoxin stability system
MSESPESRSSKEITDVSISEARDNLSEYCDRAHYLGERFGLTRRGKRRAGLIPTKELEMFDEIKAAIIEIRKTHPEIDNYLSDPKFWS